MSSRSLGRIAFAAVLLAIPAVDAEEPGEPVQVVGPGSNARQPQMAVDPEGRVFVAYGIGNTIYCAVSTDGGRSFGPSATVGSVPTLALGMRRGPRIAATEDAVIVTAVGGEQGMGRDGDVLAWRSTDGGTSWTGPMRLNAVEGSAREGLHALAAGPEGRIFCAWLDLRHDGMELFGALSTDGGATWEPDRLIYRSPDKKICTCCHPSLAYAPDGTLFAMWRNDLGGARDMYLSASRDDGRSFGPASRLGEKTWILDACPMDGGALTVGPEGQIETFWMRAGSMFAAEPGQPERPLGAGVQGWVARGPDGPWFVWLDRRPGRLLVQGPGDERPRTLAESANDPVNAGALGGRGPVVAAWEDGRGGIAAIRLVERP